MTSRAAVPALLLAALALSSCATPAQRCRSDATRDLAVVRQLVAETRGNISRGYGYETELERSSRLTFCLGGRHRRVGTSFCTSDRLVERERPVAIDLAAEQAKLRSLEAKEQQLAARARQSLAACPAG